MEKVLLVEDDENIASLVALHLTDAGCEVTLETDGVKGLERAMAETFQLIVLDIGLPKMSGLEVCRHIRKNRKYTPILMLTAKSEEDDKIAGLELGADDYITKPFGVRELVARVKAILRRTQAVLGEMQKTGKLITYKDMIIDTENRIVQLNSERIELTPKEFDLLFMLAQKPGRSYTRQQLLDNVWGYQFEGLEHTVNSHINRLRIKVEVDITKPQYVLTTWGVGYRFGE
jgi:two-component system, OmpR family, alkaline phosphatase synthesis response regulator PhoP